MLRLFDYNGVMSNIAITIKSVRTRIAYYPSISGIIIKRIVGIIQINFCYLSSSWHNICFIAKFRYTL